MTFSYVENESSAKIKVIGVGGAGGNAVNNMIDAKLQGVKFIVANTDIQALDASRAEVKIQIGKELTEGLGAGADPNKGREAALESMDELKKALEDSHMVFITAGFGGGTGTGAAPVIAEICKDLG
ncbi:MAG: cell division protein FtsZ, partial [Desulfobacula sp.]|nr:cell division protein FtsZ [Desulfobacula sp.]